MGGAREDQRDGIGGSDMKVLHAEENGRHARAWLGCCRHLLRQCRGTGTSLGRLSSRDLFRENLTSNLPSDPHLQGNSPSRVDDPPASEPSHSSLSRKLDSCTSAFRALCSAPHLQPTLLVHPLQREALRSWLKTAEGGVTASRSASGSLSDAPTEVPSLASQVTATSGRVEGGAVLSSYLLPDGSSMPSSILLYEEEEEDTTRGEEAGSSVSMDVRGLVDETDMAGELRERQQRLLQPGDDGVGEGPVAVRLSRDAISEILKFHPDDGVRWQVGKR